MDTIVVTQLRKSYGPTEVLHGIDLRVPRGALYGFLGPNGAGKSTTLRILVGLLRASGGRAEINGRDCWRHGPMIRAGLGYLPGDVRLYDHLTGRQTLRFLDGVRRTRSTAEIERLARVFDLDLGVRVRSYSRGMKQKLAVIATLMHQPPVLILDEPTTALDPLIQERVHDELRANAQSGRTVLFSSHTLREVEQLCDRVAILRAGLVVEEAPIADLRRRALRRVELVLTDGHQPGAFPAGLHVHHQVGPALTASWTGDLSPLLDWLNRQPVADVVIAPPDLDDLFKAYYAADEVTP